jgi:hypothetical protein
MDQITVQVTGDIIHFHLLEPMNFQAIPVIAERVDVSKLGFRAIAFPAISFDMAAKI